jgi:hypothetical protein
MTKMIKPNSRHSEKPQDFETGYCDQQCGAAARDTLLPRFGYEKEGVLATVSIVRRHDKKQKEEASYSMCKAR